PYHGSNAGNFLLDFLETGGGVGLVGGELKTEVEQLLLGISQGLDQLGGFLLPQFCRGHASSRVSHWVLTGSLWPRGPLASRRMASRARSSSTPASSNMIRPGFTTDTQNSGLPLPEPIRVSAGFWVTGLSGKIVIQTLPPRLMARVMAIRADSIWRAVIHPDSRAWRPYSPKLTWVPPLATPLRRPRWTLRCLVRLGINMSVSSR